MLAPLVAECWSVSLGHGCEGQLHVDPRLGAGLHEGNSILLWREGGTAVSGRGKTWWEDAAQQWSVRHSPSPDARPRLSWSLCRCPCRPAAQTQQTTGHRDTLFNIKFNLWLVATEITQKNTCDFFFNENTCSQQFSADIWSSVFAWKSDSPCGWDLTKKMSFSTLILWTGKFSLANKLF